MAVNITTISTTYVLVVPFTAQSHVMPLMKLPQLLVNHGRFKVTFINFECIHRRLIDSILSPNGEQKGLATNFDHGIRLASVPDGLTTAQQKDVEELYNAVYNVFPGLLERLIKNIHESGESMTCFIANETIATTIEVAERKGLLRAAFAPPVALVKVLCHSIPTLTQKGIIDDNDWLICNSSYELEPSVFSSMPNLLPIGPLLAGNQLGNLWPEDPTCFSWY